MNGHKLATGAEALAKHLEKSLGLAVKGVSKDDIKGKKGIVFFKDIKGFDNGSSGPDSGDHIDLWDGVKAKSGEYFSEAKSVWFWEVN
ncbi:MAG: hypothetical protein IPH53_16480 [Flavobacteriales bacterium]|nr:hypothetical protein [Flavobacteriales bacterium]